MRSISWLAAGLVWLGVAGAAAAVGGSVTDQAVTLTYPSDRWSRPEQLGRLVGVGTAVSPVNAFGWWYRRAGDARESKLGVPDSETYAAGRITLKWFDVGAPGLTVTEVTEVTDTEGSSGGFVSYLFAQNSGSTRQALTIFHYVDLLGITATDFATAVNPRSMLLSQPPMRAFYRAPLATHFQVSSTTAILTSLGDASLTEFADTGLPFGPGNLGAAYEFGPVVLDPCATCAPTPVATVSLFVNPADDHIKGDALGLLGQSPLLLDGGNATYVVPMRRTQALGQLVGPGLPRPTSTARPAGVDDFDGDFRDELVSRDTATGVAFVGGRPISGAPVLPLSWKLSATGDFDHDGKADILWRNTVSQKLVVWLMNGAAKTGNNIPSPDQAASSNWEVAGAADFNGDGNLDLLWYNQTTGKIVMWYLDQNLARATGLFTTPNGVGSNTWRVVAVGDFGQGAGGLHKTQDIVWQNDVSHKLVVWHMDQNATRTSGVFTTPDTIAGGLPVVGPR